ncbi:sperm microtubule associated protein 2-like [Anguilla rostrata]|uniref:sperm microtubule associated protein 2-like n=1 Tax=Anguilla rostrata TaxID=7938 RepID=UPI0030CF6A1C
MVTEKAGCCSRLCPSARILQLAQHKDSKTEWVTTPWKLTWGNQDSIWPLSHAALSAVPTERTLHLAEHKRHFSVWDEQPSRKAQDGLCLTKGSWPFPGTIQYETLVRLSAPKYRSRRPREVRPPHTQRCDRECPIWHYEVSTPARLLSPRLLQLARPKETHPSFRGNRESVETVISETAKLAHSTPRLDLLSMPKMREESHLSFPLRHLEDPIRPVSKHAKRAVASPRVKSLAVPKAVVKDYLPNRDPVWSPPRSLWTGGSKRRDKSA